ACLRLFGGDRRRGSGGGSRGAGAVGDAALSRDDPGARRDRGRAAGNPGAQGDAGEAADRRPGGARPHPAEMRGNALMFQRLIARVEARAQAVADAARQKIEAAFAQFPDMRLRIEGDEVVIEAMGLMRRWLSDTRLRFAFWRNG